MCKSKLQRACTVQGKIQVDTVQGTVHVIRMFSTNVYAQGIRKACQRQQPKDGKGRGPKTGRGWRPRGDNSALQVGMNRPRHAVNLHSYASECWGPDTQWICESPHHQVRHKEMELTTEQKSHYRVSWESPPRLLLYINSRLSLKPSSFDFSVCAWLSLSI